MKSLKVVFIKVMKTKIRYEIMKSVLHQDDEDLNSQHEITKSVLHQGDEDQNPALQS